MKTGPSPSGDARVPRVTVLPPDYVSEHVELGYATTAHRAQGRTVDTAHAYLSAATVRESLYVMATRGRETNKLYVDTTYDPDTQTSHQEPETPAPRGHPPQRHRHQRSRHLRPRDPRSRRSRLLLPSTTRCRRRRNPCQAADGARPALGYKPATLATFTFFGAPPVTRSLGRPQRCRLQAGGLPDPAGPRRRWARPWRSRRSGSCRGISGAMSAWSDLALLDAGLLKGRGASRSRHGGKRHRHPGIGRSARRFSVPRPSARVHPRLMLVSPDPRTHAGTGGNPALHPGR